MAQKNRGGGCPFLADDSDITVNVDELGSDLAALVYDRVNQLGGEAANPASASYRASFLAGFVPTTLQPLPFMGSFVGGTGLAVGLSRGLDKLVDLNPLITTGGITALALSAHLLLKKDWTFGLLLGTAPVLIEQGVNALFDLLWGDEEAALPMKPAQAGAQMGVNVTRKSMEEIQRVLAILAPKQRERVDGAERRMPVSPVAGHLPMAGYNEERYGMDAVRSLLPSAA